MNHPASRYAAPLFIAAALLAVVPTGCNRETHQARGPQSVPVQVAEAERRTVPVLQLSIGSVQTLRTVAVKSQVDGVIAEINFHEGDEVKAGDLLVTLDRRPFENSVRSAEADLANARAVQEQAVADAERYQNLDEQAVVSKEQYAQYRVKAETARAQVQAKEAALANAQLQLSYAEIRAPIAGRTGQLNLHEGALIKANDTTQAIVTINQLTPISVAYSVPESTLGGIRHASASGELKVLIAPHASTGEMVEGKLGFIDNAVDATTGTIVLKAFFDNADRRLWPGEFVDVTTFVGEEKDAVVVPSAAVQTGQNGSQIFVVKADGTVDLRTVKPGRSVAQETVVQTGVQSGETVVVDGQLRLVPGTKIEVKQLGGGPEVARSGWRQQADPKVPKS